MSTIRRSEPAGVVPTRRPRLRATAAPFVTALLLSVTMAACSKSPDSLTASTTITISNNEILAADLYCNNLTVDPGVQVVTAGYNIYCQGVVDNEGTIVTGSSPFGNFPLSYGGSGSGATMPEATSRVAALGYATSAPGGMPCQYPHCPGGEGASPPLPRLRGTSLEAWRTAGMTLFLAGAAGGAIPTARGGAGAYGLFISGSRIVAGTIEAEGAGGRSGTDGEYSGSGGGGTVILDYGTGGYKPGSYLVGGGHIGTTPSRYFDVGGNGHVAAVPLMGGSASHVMLVASSPSFTTTSSAQSSTVIATFTGHDGAPVAGVPVTWTATSGDLSATSGLTNMHGQATVTLVQGATISASSALQPELTAAVLAKDADDPSVSAVAYVEALSGVVSLLPFAGPAHSWSWTAACPFNPAPCSPPGANPDIGWLQLNGQLWNLAKTAQGGTQMAVSGSGALSSSTDLESAPAGSVDTWTRGDPAPTYGVVLGYPSGSPPESPSLRLPLQLDSVPHDVIATAHYDITARRSTSYEFGYNLWLEPSRTMEKVGPGTIDVMISTDNSGAGSLPAGSAATASVPYAVSGQVTDGLDAWDVYVSGIDAGGRTSAGGGTISFVLNSPVDSGKVSIDLSDILAAADQILENRYQWNGINTLYWLDTIQLGSEVGPGGTSLTSSGPADMSWTLSDYCFGIRKRLATAGC
jgi:hypothetical protein